MKILAIPASPLSPSAPTSSFNKNEVLKGVLMQGIFTAFNEMKKAEEKENAELKKSINS